MEERDGRNQEEKMEGEGESLEYCGGDGRRGG